MRRTNASLIYRRTKNTRAVQILLGHTKLESTESPMVSWTYPTDCLWPVPALHDRQQSAKQVRELAVNCLSWYLLAIAEMNRTVSHV